MTSTFSPGAFMGQRVLITGASGGLGAECARVFHSVGAELVLLDLDEARLTEMEHSFHGDQAVTRIVGDLATSGHRAAAAEQVAELGGVDHLVLAAGIYREKPFADMTEADFDHMMQVNLTSTVQLVRSLLDQLHNGGSIVLFSSMAGERGSCNHSHYAATKGALVSFGRSLAWELGPRNIRVNALSPGIIRTPMTDDLVHQAGPHLIASTPLGRFGEPAEVAGAAVFLCSAAATFLTGVTLQINGGLHMG